MNKHGELDGGAVNSTARRRREQQVVKRELVAAIKAILGKIVVVCAAPWSSKSASLLFFLLFFRELWILKRMWLGVVSCARLKHADCCIVCILLLLPIFVGFPCLLLVMFRLLLMQQSLLVQLLWCRLPLLARCLGRGCALSWWSGLCCVGSGSSVPWCRVARICFFFFRCGSKRYRASARESMKVSQATALFCKHRGFDFQVPCTLLVSSRLCCGSGVVGARAWHPLALAWLPCPGCGCCSRCELATLASRCFNSSCSAFFSVIYFLWEVVETLHF